MRDGAARDVAGRHGQVLQDVVELDGVDAADDPEGGDRQRQSDEEAAGGAAARRVASEARGSAGIHRTVTLSLPCASMVASVLRPGLEGVLRGWQLVWWAASSKSPITSMYSCTINSTIINLVSGVSYYNSILMVLEYS